MRIKATIILLFTMISCGWSQETTDHHILISSVEDIDEECVSDDREYLNGMVPIASYTPEKTETDSLHLPTLDYSGRMLMPHSWRWGYLGGFGGWSLHKGLNVNLGMSAFTSFGDYKFSGFTQNISAMYAAPITDKLSIAVGGYFNNMNTNRGDFRDAGISAVLNYRFNEHWEAYVFAQKSLSSSLPQYQNCWMNPWMMGYGMMGCYGPYGPMGMDRIGGGVRYNFNNNFSIDLQVEYDHAPNAFHNSVKEHWEMPHRP